MIDLAALLLAPELKARLLLAEATKDGFSLLCYADLPRDNVRYALRNKGFLQQFDSLIYAELMSELTASELRLLGDTSKTLWIRLPDEVDYARLLHLRSTRKRLLPKALRMKALAQSVILDAASDSPIPDSHED